jgi:hypothetical protein
MVDPPRLHQQLGAKRVEVTKATFGKGKPEEIFDESGFENEASNTR